MTGLPELRTTDPFEYGYRRAGAQGKYAYFLETIKDEDMTTRELMIEGWDAYYDEHNIEGYFLPEEVKPPEHTQHVLSVYAIPDLNSSERTSYKLVDADGIEYVLTEDYDFEAVADLRSALERVFETWPREED